MSKHGQMGLSIALLPTRSSYAKDLCVGKPSQVARSPQGSFKKALETCLNVCPTERTLAEP